MKSIEISLDWNILEVELLRQSRGLIYEKELRKMINGISSDVTALSKLEVSARRRGDYIIDDSVTKINQNIEIIKEFLLVAALLG